MVDAQLNYFDMAVIGIMLLSCLFAFFRGFVKEILSLMAWVGAGAITIHFFPSLLAKLQPHFSKAVVAAICTTTILYIGSLIGFAIMNRFIIKILKSGSEIGWFDNVLGLAFGALRGALIISLSFFMISVAIPEKSRPTWLENAVTRPYAEKGALMLASFAPSYLDELSNLQKKASGSVNGAIVEEAGKSTYDSAIGSVGYTIDNNKTVVNNKITENNNKVEESEKYSKGSIERLLQNLDKK